MRRKIKNEAGWALLISLIAIGAVSALAIGVLKTTQNSQITTSLNYRSERVQENAEAGVNAALINLREQYEPSFLARHDPTDFINDWLPCPSSYYLLCGSPPPIFPKLSSGSVEATTTLRDNNDGNSSYLDNDYRVWVSTTAKWGGFERRIEALVEFGVKDLDWPQSPLVVARETDLFGNIINPSTQSQISITGAAGINGLNYDLPAYGCQGGSNCNALADPAATPTQVPGITYDDAETDINLNGGHLTDVTSDTADDPNLDHATWTNAIRYADKYADYKQYLGGLYPCNVTVNQTQMNNLANEIGSPTNPKIFVVTGSPGCSLTLNANFYGSGILVIDKVDVTFAGTFVFAGLVAVRNGGKVLFTNPQSMTLSGRSQIYGGVISVSGNLNLDIQGRADIFYSSKGLGLAKDAFPFRTEPITIVAWRYADN